MSSLLPKSLRLCIEFFEKLPGIGPKSAKRLGFYLLRLPQRDLENYAANLTNLKKSALYCRECFNLTETERCLICDDASRNKDTIVIVETVLDLLAFEAGTQYDGVYHVLHGRIDPLNYIGPDDIFLPQLFTRIEKRKDTLKEIIIATNPNTEGEATAIHIKNQLAERYPSAAFSVSRLAYGLPIGAELEYADYMTLKRAIDGRQKM